MQRPHRSAGAPDQMSTYIGVAVGALGALFLGAVMLPLRDHLPSADFALALVVPVLIGAVIGGRIAGVVAAVVAALTFDFIFTKPYLSLRITGKDDVATFIALAIVGLIAAELAARTRRQSADARRARSEVERLVRVAGLSASGADAADVVSAARAELIGLFDLVDCVYEGVPSGPELPSLSERGALEHSPLVAVGEFLLPTGGVQLRVRGRGKEFGRLVLYAGDATLAPLDKRLVAVAIADEVGLTLATA
ncbi:MAG TPA: DUF4118 domain-containing protein [Acidimicrobiia bacterium]|nr:DUF4118 domain-containing protein [Acidimicrobiia bacterium]